MPRSPIPVRSGAAAVWTGSTLFVWGGAIGNSFRSDGAQYDPVGRRWTVLPRSPLAARAETQATVVDGSVILWGGGTDRTSLGDGARFDLRTRTWSRLPNAPGMTGADAELARLVTAGSSAALVSAPTHTQTRTVRIDLYDPRTNSWRTARPRDDHRREFVWLSALGVGTDVYVWPAWQHVVHTGPGSTETTAGVDAYRLDTRDGTWHDTTTRPDPGFDASGVVLAGHRVLFPQAQVYCGECSHPFSPDMRPVLVDLTDGARTVVPNGPLGSAGDSLFWTGTALLSYNPNAQLGRSILPGAAAVWANNTWTRLRSAPTPPDAMQATVSWTGTVLLVWGVAAESGRVIGTGGTEFSAPSR